MTALATISRLAAEPAWSFHADGTCFDLACPHPGSVCFIEVGQTLAGIRRFNGRGVSVAQHSVMGAQAILNEGGSHMEARLYFLHDAHEWALGDITRPVEKLLNSHLLSVHGMAETGAFSEAIEALKDKWDEAIYTAAALPVPEFWTTRQKKVVKDMDDRMCREEAIQRFGPRAASQFNNSSRPKTTGTFKLWGQADAEEKFAEMAHRLIGSDQIARQAAIACAARQKVQP
ncbi:HD domain protein [Neorhizobium galegae bv. officinalis]|nr:HD domain protein [Neorhizobium galegae bv. officinalis]